MSTIYKNFAALFCIIALLCAATTTSTAFAASSDEAPPVYGLSITPPTDSPPATRSTDYPTNVRNMSVGGQYSFGASVRYGNLMYTDYRFTGKSSYTVTVYNTGNYRILVRAFKVKRFSTNDDMIKYITIAPKASATFTVGGLSNSDQIYLGFNNDVNDDFIIFNGVIR